LTELIHAVNLAHVGRECGRQPRTRPPNFGSSAAAIPATLFGTFEENVMVSALKSLSTPEVDQLLSQLQAEREARDADSADADAKWIRIAPKDVIFDPREWVDACKGYGLDPVLKPTDKGMCIGVGIGKGFGGGIGIGKSLTGIVGGCFPKSIPADPFRGLAQFLASKGVDVCVHL
jgi:hypothetical protein